MSKLLQHHPAHGLTGRIISAAITVHRHLGPGLLESAYQACLAHQLIRDGLSIDQQVPLPLVYQGVKLDCGYRLDLRVEQQVIVEVKTVARIERVHLAQLLTYLRLADLQAGLLLNFNVNALVAGGIKRVLRDK